MEEAISLGAGPCPTPSKKNMQRNLSVWPDWPCRQRAKGSTLPKEILEAKPIGSYPLHKPEQLHFGYDPELNQSCSALIQQISPVAQSTRPLFTMAAQHTLQVSSSQGQHQNQSMPNKDFFFFLPLPAGQRCRQGEKRQVFLQRPFGLS